MTPRISYQAEDNAAYIRFSENKVVDSAELAPGIVVDYDEAGQMVGMELLDAKKQLPSEVLASAA